MVWVANWQYFVSHFGDSNITDHVFWSAGVRLRNMHRLFLTYATPLVHNSLDRYHDGHSTLVSFSFRSVWLADLVTSPRFFSYRLYRLSKGNWLVVAPVVSLALARVGACASI